MSAAFAGQPARAQQTPAPAAVRTADALRFDVPAGALDAALKVFAEATGLVIDLRIPADTASMMHSPGVSGTLPPARGAHALLDGTSLGFQIVGDTVVIDVRASPSRCRSRAASRRRRRPSSRPLRDIPQTITVISSRSSTEQGATTLRDVLRNVAGITFQAGEGGVPAGDQLSIRGFSARTDMFVDGVRDFGGYSRDSFNLEQVEVAKGPDLVARRPWFHGRCDQPGQQGAEPQPVA